MQEWVQDARAIVFFTGAGCSAEAGIPTYRGRGGVWSEYRPERCASQAAFDRDPDAVWDFHDVRRAAMAAADPTRAHRVIAALQDGPARVAVVTQNIDGLHTRAGSTVVHELHGSVWRTRCACPDSPRDDHDLPAVRRCPDCDAWKRPDIIWFGDMLNGTVVSAAVDVLRQCDLFVSIGTSAVVYPAAELPRLAVDGGARCIEINPEETPASGLYQHHVRAPATTALAALWPEVADALD